MKVYFSKRKCESCGYEYDPTMYNCPNCQNRNADLETSNRFLNDIHVDWYFNLTFFLVGLIGLSVIGTIVLIFIQAYDPSGNSNSLYAFYTYAILFVVLGAILYFAKGYKEVFKSFSKWQSYVFGLAGAAAMVILSVFLSLIVELIAPGTGSNTNQNTVVNITVAYPVASIIILGIIGPLCEELTYRVGLFGLLKRVSRPIAYIGTAIVFGFIHFDFECFYDGSTAIAREFLNLPSYMISGLVMAFLYDRFGFGASSCAHMFNNLYSVIGIIALYSQA